MSLSYHQKDLPLKAIVCGGKIKDATFMFEMLKDAINEVGPSNVVHVITNADLFVK